MTKSQRWSAASTAAVALNAMLFLMVAYLISRASVPAPPELVSVKLLVLEAPPPPEPPPPLPPKPKPPLVKKMEPRPVLDQPPLPDIEKLLEPLPEPKTIGLDEDKEPEPEPPPLPSQPPEPEYIPGHKLTRLPAFVRKEEPVYPEKERFTGREARVVVELFLDTEGKINSIRIVESGGEAFDEAVKNALNESIFAPGYMGQRPVAVRVQIPFLFKLR
ncbi:MAG: energy transducer TonB [Nitrospinota bacterium]|nr:energy transducer TonB [Nitrospinota bacterium]